jgi:hypothetical protein
MLRIGYCWHSALGTASTQCPPAKHSSRIASLDINEREHHAQTGMGQPLSSEQEP